ncbi:MAG: penicillin-binding protein 2, partial [Planctomycetota bacterium]
MYDKRIKIFITLIAFLLLVCLLRLGQMQLQSGSFYQDRIAELKRQRGLSKQLKTVRGRVLDRNGKVLAADQLQFQLHIDYRLTSVTDERVRQAKLLTAAKKTDPDIAISSQKRQFEAELADLQRVLDKCAHFGLEHADFQNKIESINNRMWNLRTFLAWLRNGPDRRIIRRYGSKISIPLSEAIADFEKKFPASHQRLLLIDKVDNIADMDKTWPLLELKTDDDIFAAQLEFIDINNVRILPKAHRFYPYSSTAAQTIGWVGPAQQRDKRLFANDRLSSYLDDEVCGREDGVEYVCETVLRGRRGEVFTDIDGQQIDRA